MITYFLPGVGIYGGVAVVLQHANRLQKRGHDVCIVNVFGLETNAAWFSDNNVKIITLKDYENYVKYSDITIATHFSTVDLVEKLPTKRKLYFVQSDERRFVPDYVHFDMCHKSYNNHNFEYMTEALWIQRWLKEEFHHNAYYVPNGLDETLFYPTEHRTEKREKLRVLFEGSINIPFKGMQDAYNAVKDLDCELWIVSNDGIPPEEWKYDKFFESVPMQEMKEIYSQCDIFLKMSRVEGFFGPPLEAMACGCAVVVGKCTGYDEYIVHNHNALVVEQGDIASAKVAVQKLINDKELRDRLIVHGKQTAHAWSWDRSIDYLERVLKKKPPQTLYTQTHPSQYDYHSDVIARLTDIFLKEQNKTITQEKEIILLKSSNRLMLKNLYANFKKKLKKINHK